MKEIELSGVSPSLRTALIIGEHGTGKTHFLKTCPKPLYVFSFDQGYRTIAAEPGVKVAFWEKEQRTQPTVYKQFMPQFRALMRREIDFTWTDGRKEKFRSIALDGWPFLSTSIFDHWQYINSNVGRSIETPDKPAGYSGYGLVRSHSEDILRAVMDASEADDITAIVTALPELVKDEDNPGTVYLGPACIGSIKNVMGAMFDLVAFAHVDPAKDKAGRPRYWLRTQTMGLERCRLRLPSQIADCLAMEEEPDFGRMKGKIDAAWRVWQARQPKVSEKVAILDAAAGLSAVASQVIKDSVQGKFQP